MEDAEGGSLRKAIPSLLWEHKRRIAGEIAHGLSYIHSQGIIHCDIKSPNVLLTKKLEVKICDFGCSMTTADKKDKTPSCGTLEWKAPELLLDATAYSSKSDIYALGIVMWEMASCDEPHNRTQLLETKLENVPEDYLVVMQSCWDVDPMRRPEAQDLSIMKYERGLEEELERFLRTQRDSDMSKKVFDITVAQSTLSDLKVDFDVEKRTVKFTLIDLIDPVALKYESTAESLLKSANNGCDRSKAALALSYYESGRYTEALVFAQEVSHIPAACYVMGEMYRHGYGVDQNEGEARRLHHDAAKGGFSRSQFLMAHGCAKAGHHSEAVYWYRMAAVGGDLDGQYNFGEMIYNGRGVPSDRKEGERWIRKAADRGNMYAVAAMGVVCIDLEEYSEAMQWCLKVGTPISHYRIGVLYFYGRGTEPNCASAMKWFEKAADQRCGLAAFALAEMYREGVMVEKDINKAIELYLRGIEYEHADSKNALAILLKEQGGNAIPYNKYLKEAQEEGSVLAKANLLIRDI
ncbi:mitogen-activated protein kinase kinase kinase 9 [Mortierella claussenii]|nr:mitogen-activated protein kinase kinase kinase 9 [Mortierella claussenii]